MAEDGCGLIKNLFPFWVKIRNPEQVCQLRGIRCLGESGQRRLTQWQTFLTPPHGQMAIEIWRAPDMVFKSNWRWQDKFQSIKLPSVPKSIRADTENEFSGEVISWIRVKKCVGVEVVEVWLANGPPFTVKLGLLLGIEHWKCQYPNNWGRVLHNWHHCWQPTTEVGKTSPTLSIVLLMRSTTGHSELCQSRDGFLQKALEDTFLLRAHTLPTALTCLIFLTLISFSPIYVHSFSLTFPQLCTVSW